MKAAFWYVCGGACRMFIVLSFMVAMGIAIAVLAPVAIVDGFRQGLQGKTGRYHFPVARYKKDWIEQARKRLHIKT